MFKNLIAIGSVLAVVACGQVSSQQLSNLDSDADLKNKIVLEAGRYLVSASALETCTPGGVTLKQKIDFGSFAGEKNDRVTLSIEDRISDNFIRLAVCSAGYLKGTASLNFTKSTVVVLDGLTLDSVEKVAEVETATPTVTNGRYIVAVQAPGSCRDRLINLTQTLVFNLDAINPILDIVTLSSKSKIETNEITTLECRAGSVNRGETLVTVANPMPTTPSKIVGSDLTVGTVLKVVKTESVYSKNSEK